MILLCDLKTHLSNLIHSGRKSSVYPLTGFRWYECEYHHWNSFLPDLSISSFLPSPSLLAVPLALAGEGSRAGRTHLGTNRSHQHNMGCFPRCMVDHCEANLPPSCMEGSGPLQHGPIALKKTFEKQTLGLNEKEHVLPKFSSEAPLLYNTGLHVLCKVLSVICRGPVDALTSPPMSRNAGWSKERGDVTRKHIMPMTVELMHRPLSLHYSTLAIALWFKWLYDVIIYKYCNEGFIYSRPQCYWWKY